MNVRRNNDITWLAVASAALIVACGSSTPAESSARTPSDEPTASEPPESGHPATESSGASGEAAESGATGNDVGKGEKSASDASASEESADEDNRKRNVIYRMTGTGLVIEVEGVRFEPTVKAIQKKGGWGVKVSVKATSTDGKMHRLLSPENGPLAFAAKVEKKGQVLASGDERKGEDEAFVPPDDSTEFSREYPGPKEAPLWGGQSLELQVGLWGLAPEAERRRPVRKLFVVKMTTGNTKPQPVITPPE